MKMKSLLFVLVACFAVLLSACSEAGMEKRLEYAKIVESRSAQELLNDLYVGSDGDVGAIARMVNASPSSLERIRKGETEPTEQFEERIYEVSMHYVQNGQSFSKLRSVLDPEYGWYDSVLNFPTHHPWWFWGINILVFLFLAFVSAFIGSWILLAEMVVFLFAWIASLIFSPGPVMDVYVNVINPTIEQIL